MGYNNKMSERNERVRKAGRTIMLLELKHGITIEDKRKFRGVEWWYKSDAIECPLEKVIFHYNSLLRFIENNRK